MQSIEVQVGRRASPINAQEREFFLELIQDEPILADRRTDGRTVSLKKQAWQRIAVQLNAAGYGEPKTAYQLQKIWERMKIK